MRGVRVAHQKFDKYQKFWSCGACFCTVLCPFACICVWSKESNQLSSTTPLVNLNQHGVQESDKGSGHEAHEGGEGEGEGEGEGCQGLQGEDGEGEEGSDP